MRFAANSRTTTRQVSTAEVTDSPVAQLISDMRRSSTLQVGDPAVVLVAAAGEQPRFDVARAVDDPRQPGGEDVEERADAAQQEHRGEGEPDDLRDGVDRKVRRGFEHGQRYAYGGAASASPPHPPFAIGDFEQHQPVHREARGEDPGEAGDQLARRPEHGDDDRRHATGPRSAARRGGNPFRPKCRPQPDRARRSRSSRRRG